MQFSQPGRKFSAKGPKTFALNATKKSKDISCEKKLSNYSSDDVETFFDNFFKIFSPVVPENFPKMSEETKQKKFPEQSP